MIALLTLSMEVLVLSQTANRASMPLTWASALPPQTRRVSHFRERSTIGVTSLLWLNSSKNLATFF